VKQILFIVRSAPYGSAAIPESVRSCLGFATMPVEVHYLLTGDGAWALQPGQEPGGIGARDTLGMIADLADLDVRLYVEEQALEERGLSVEGLEAEVKPLGADEIAKLIAAVDAVITY